MKTRKLGKNGPEVSAIGLGCMGLSFGLGPAIKAAPLSEGLDAAIDRSGGAAK